MLPPLLHIPLMIALTQTLKETTHLNPSRAQTHSMHVIRIYNKYSLLYIIRFVLVSKITKRTHFTVVIHLFESHARNMKIFINLHIFKTSFKRYKTSFIWFRL